MSKGVSDMITYKPYDQGQAYLIPPRVDELLPANHLVRLVSEVIDEMGIERLLRKHRGAGDFELAGLPPISGRARLFSFPEGTARFL
jgi:hypothetical protein